MVYKKLVACLCTITLLSGLPLVSYAQDGVISLREAIRQTLENNPQLREYNLRGQALSGEMQSANLKPALRLSSEVENVIGTGDLNWFQGTELTLALSQVIELGDKRAARSDVVSRRQSLLTARQRVLELELLAQTTRRFIELAAVEQQRNLMSRATALARETQATVSERVAVGRAPNAELARATAALRMAELAEESARFELNAARINLSSLWGQLDPEFEGAAANLLELGETATIELLLSRLENNPAILVFGDEERLRQAELREVQTRSRSSIEVGAGIRHLAELNDTAFTVQASIPLGSKKRNSGAVATAQANLLLVESQRDAAMLRMSARLLSLDQQRQQAVNKVRVIQQSVLPQLVMALDETRAAFDSGRYGYVELSAAQQDLLDVEFGLIEAAARAHQLTAEIERLSGEPFTNGVTQ
ncbi:MAG: TolC family protein [Gammaproteobacteria bacterium]|nr:TolC family protein [Gammaproteobacteria bacterium]